MPKDVPPAGGQPRLSPDARRIEDQARDLIDDVSTFEVGATRRRKRELGIKALIGILMLLTVGVFVSWMALRQAAIDDNQGARDLTAEDTVAEAPAEPAPEAGPSTLGDCAVNPASLQLASTVTLRDRGVNDPAMFLVQWDAGVINNSTEPILVTARIASSDGTGGSAWEDSYLSVGPSQAHLWPSNYVTNNAGGSAGATTWRYVDQVLAVRDSPSCAELLASPTAETAKAAVPADVPRLPANAQVPAR